MSGWWDKSMRRLLTLRDDDRGAAIIELAIIAPVLALLTIGVVDMSNGFGRKMKLEQAAQRAIEKVMNTTGDKTVEATIIAEASEQAEVTADKVKVNYRVECNGTLTAEVSCPEGVQEAKWISVEVNDVYEPLFKIKFGGAEADGTYKLKATAGMRVE